MNKKILNLILFLAALMFFYNASAIPNPWTDCDQDTVCATKKAGFSFPLNVKNYTLRAMENMYEIRFPLDKERDVIVRKSVMPEGESDENGIIDISGDYNKYTINKTITLRGNIKFSVRGEKEDNYNVVNFAAETGYYSIMCDKGLNLKDIEYFYQILEEAEAPKYQEE